MRKVLASAAFTNLFSVVRKYRIDREDPSHPLVSDRTLPKLFVKWFRLKINVAVDVST